MIAYSKRRNYTLVLSGFRVKAVSRVKAIARNINVIVGNRYLSFRQKSKKTRKLKYMRHCLYFRFVVNFSFFSSYVKRSYITVT